MATIRTAIQVTDGMSPAFKSMNRAMNTVLNSFEALQGASSNSIDTGAIQAARAELNRAQQAFIGIDEEIERARRSQENLNQGMRNGRNEASGLLEKVKGIAMSIGLAFGTKKVMDFSDELTSIKARLKLMNDGLQTTEELQNKIFQSAQRSRASYIDTASAVAKLGILAKDAFNSNEEMIFFAEQMNKQFKIGGASIQEQTSAMYQLTQAMAAGRLQGDEFRSIMENAPMLAQSIADHMGKTVGELREMSSEGLITADVIKNSMFAAAEETNAKFAELPVTFGQMWTDIKNKAIQAFDPVLAKISSVTNNDNFNKLVDNVVGGLVIIASVSAGILGIVSGISAFFTDNWGVIEPIVLGIAAAMLLYNGALIANSAIQAINTGIQTAQAIAMAVKTGTTVAEAAATNGLTAAQWALNSAMLASPITWIILAVIALIAVFYAVIGAINKFADTSISGTGIIMGVFATAGAFIANIFMGLLQLVFGIVEYWYNLFAAFANFFGNLFNDPIGAVINLFADLADNVLGVLEKIASAMDFIFGSNMADTVKGWRADLQVMAETAVKEYGNGTYQDRVSELDINGVLDDLGLSMDRFNYSDAWKAGYDLGESIESKLDLGNILGGASDTLDAYSMGSTLDGIYNSVDDTAANTTSMKDSMDVSSEELKYLRDLAEQEAINKFTTAEIKVDMGGVVNQVNQDTDLDGMVAYLEDTLYETMLVASEGVDD